MSAGFIGEELLRNFQQAGVFDFAQDLGIIPEGSLIDGDDRVDSGAGMGGLSDIMHHGKMDAGTASEAAAAARAAVLQHARKRPLSEEGGSDEERGGQAADDGPTPAKKKRVARVTPVLDKGGKGLRHFSMKVCEKVESKGRTTYNEVADELVKEFSHPEYASEQQFDEKNIRRRVYDALNVLMAMNIITKEKKDITWRGLPPSVGSDLQSLRNSKAQARQRCDKKRAHLAELVEQHSALEALLLRNAEARVSGADASTDARIALPFILVQTRPGTAVEVEVSDDQQLVHFDFNATPFEIRDDNFVLARLNLAPPAAVTTGRR